VGDDHEAQHGPIPEKVRPRARREMGLPPRTPQAGSRPKPASFDGLAKQVGELCTKAGTADVVDASVALAAARPGVRTLYTSDPDDLRRLLDAAGGNRPRVVTC
jgi:hypothetical protein